MSGRKLFFLGIIVILLIFFPGYSRLQELREKNKALLAKIEELKKENIKLSGQIEKLENDPLYIEKKARNKVGVGRDGEIKYKVIYENKESQ